MCPLRVLHKLPQKIRKIPIPEARSYSIHKCKKIVQKADWFICILCLFKILFTTMKSYTCANKIQSSMCWSGNITIYRTLWPVCLIFIIITMAKDKKQQQQQQKTYTSSQYLRYCVCSTFMPSSCSQSRQINW